VYHDVAHKRTLRLDQAETRITNAGLSPEERDAFLERLEAQRAKLEELREKAESFDDDTTKEELKAYVAELREAQENSRRSVNVGRAHGVTNKLRNAKNALNKQLERVRTVTTDRELDFAAGIDTVQADIDKIDEFSNKLLELISDGDIEDAKEVMKEARNHVRDTHKALKDLISEVRTALQAE
jgi:signal transduction histidine kinase